MTHGHVAPDAIDTRLIFRVYGICGMLVGFAALSWGMLLIPEADRTALGPTANLTVALVAIWMLTIYAGVSAKVDDPVRRLQAVKEFAIAHFMVASVVWSIEVQIPGDRPLPPLVSIPLGFGAVLAYIAFTAAPRRRFSMTARSGAAASGRPDRVMALREKRGAGSLGQLRSQYEEQIRHAARREERARLARDLHDAVKQQLFVVQTAAATAQARFHADPAGAQAAIEQVRAAAREAITEMSAMLDHLHAAPVENIGLVEALRKHCDALGFRTGADVTLRAGRLPAPYLLPPGAQEALFRVAQEALANIGRHARASHATVSLEQRGRAVALEIVDDGTGFDVFAPRTGSGLRNIQERAGELGGRLELTSSPGSGTTILLLVPLAAQSSRRYLVTAAAFAAALPLWTFLFARSDAWSARVWVVAGAAIALIGTIRYAVAFARVRHLEQQAG